MKNNKITAEEQVSLEHNWDRDISDFATTIQLQVAV